MATKVIKLQNNTDTLLPVTDATLVQMKVGNETKSVQEVILENELIVARAYNDLDNRIDNIEDSDIVTENNLESNLGAKILNENFYLDSNFVNNVGAGTNWVPAVSVNN